MITKNQGELFLVRWLLFFEDFLFQHFHSFAYYLPLYKEIKERHPLNASVPVSYLCYRTQRN